MPAKPTDTAAVARAVTAVVRSPFGADLAAAYFDPAHGFAGAMFDGLDSSAALAHNPPERFVADDIAAASLLDVRFGPVAVRALLTDPAISAALDAVPVGALLWEATDELAAATRLWKAVRALDGVGRTRASKLLARKRPHLVPIVDSVIADALQFNDDTWGPLAKVLSNEVLRDDIERLRPAALSTEISLLRLLDVVTWTTHSRSTAAVRLQQSVGAPTARDLARRGRTN